MKPTKIKRSVIFPLVLLVYLAVVAYIGRNQYYSGDRLSYCAIIGANLLIIVALYFVLRKKEKLREQRDRELEKSLYTTYAEEEAANKDKPTAGQDVAAENDNEN